MEAEALHPKEAAYWAAASAEAERPDNNVSSLPSPDQPLSNAKVAALAGQFFSRAKAQLDLNARGPADFEPEEAATVEADLEWQLFIPVAEFLFWGENSLSGRRPEWVASGHQGCGPCSVS